MSFKQVFVIFVSQLFFAGFTTAQDFTADVTSGCNPLTVQFSLTGASTVTAVLWDFGNGETSTETNPVVTYQNPGVFTVSAQFNNDVTNVVEKTDYITVNEVASAEFHIDTVDFESLLFSMVPDAEIQEITNQFSFRWEMHWGDTSINKTYFVYNGEVENAILDYQFPDTGSYTISLSTRNIIAGNCVAYSEQTFLLREEDPEPPAADSVFQAPNVFSPNSDPYHYIIEPDSYDEEEIILYFEVFTRSGVPVYTSEAPGVFWDGRTNNGRELNTGVYYFVLRSKQGDPNGFYNTAGFIHLFR